MYPDTLGLDYVSELNGVEKEINYLNLFATRRNDELSGLTQLAWHDVIGVA